MYDEEDDDDNDDDDDNNNNNNNNFAWGPLDIFVISCSILLKIRNVSDKICRENYNTFCVQ